MIAAIGDSIEQRRRVVIEAYLRILERRPDPAGLEFWSRGIIDRLTVQELQSQIFGSIEFYDRSGDNDTAFVESLYRRILNRDAEPAGLAYWLEQLDGRTSRSELANEFLVSAEGLRQPPLSILASTPSRNASVQVLRTLEIELDRSIEARSSAVLLSIDGHRLTGATQAIPASPNRIRFVLGAPFDAASTPRSVVATVLAFDGSTVERVDYAFVLAAGGIVAPPTSQVGNPNEMMVAYYGHPTTDTLGIAGEGSPNAALAGLLDQADAYRAPGRTVIPVFEMIATLVTANPGTDALYRSRASEG